MSEETIGCRKPQLSFFQKNKLSGGHMSYIDQQPTDSGYQPWIVAHFLASARSIARSALQINFRPEVGIPPASYGQTNGEPHNERWLAAVLMADTSKSPKDKTNSSVAP